MTTLTRDEYTKVVRDAEQQVAQSLGGAPILSPVVEMQRLAQQHLGEESLAVPADMFWRFVPAYDAVLEQQKQMIMETVAHPRPNRMVCGVWIYPDGLALSVPGGDRKSSDVWNDIRKRMVEDCFRPNPLAELPPFRFETHKIGVQLTEADKKPAKTKAADKRIDEMRLVDYRACIAAMLRPYEF